MEEGVVGSEFIERVVVLGVRFEFELADVVLEAHWFDLFHFSLSF